MSLSVCAIQLVEGRIVRIEGGESKSAGGERWRTAVWGSNAVVAIAETVRRPRPSRLILPSLATQDIIAEGEELLQLELEVNALLAVETEIAEDFRLRLLNIKAAIELARTVPGGAVWIS